MQMEKKRVLKQDGRYLVFYHFPATATPEQTALFEQIQPVEDRSAEQDALPAGRAGAGGSARV